MRRYAAFHSHSTQFGNYVRLGEVLSGSIPDTEPGKIMRWFKRFEKPQGTGLVHFTLSMPEGMRLSDCEWHDVASYVLDCSGLPPDLVPWTMAGREPTRCDHVHILSGLQTWSGRYLEVNTSKRFTDALDRTLRHHLGIPELNWNLPPEVSLVSPVRAIKKHALAESFAKDFNHALDFYLPTTLDDLNAALGRIGSNWTVSNSMSRDGLLAPFDDFWKVSINPMEAGAHFSSKALFARLSFAKRVATARAAQFIVRLARFINPDNIPTLRIGKQNDIPHPGQRSPENEDRPRAGGYQETSPALGSAGTNGPRRDQRVRGKADGIDGGNQGRIRRTGSSVPGDAAELRRNEQEAGFPVGDRRRGRGYWLIRLRLLARALGIRITACFEAGGQIIKVTDAQREVLRLDLRAMVVEAGDMSVDTDVNKITIGLLESYGADFSEPEIEISEDDQPEPF